MILKKNRQKKIYKMIHSCVRFECPIEDDHKKKGISFSFRIQKWQLYSNCVCPGEEITGVEEYFTNHDPVLAHLRP
jgi:hypothetical protein